MIHDRFPATLTVLLACALGFGGDDEPGAVLYPGCSHGPRAH